MADTPTEKCKDTGKRFQNLIPANKVHLHWSLNSDWQHLHPWIFQILFTHYRNFRTAFKFSSFLSVAKYQWL